MHIFSSIKAQKFRVALIVSALFISAASLIYSHYLTRALYVEEVGKMDVWAQAMRSLATANEHTDLNLVLKVINSNHTIPVIVTDAHGTILTQRNLHPEPSGADSLQQLQQVAARMRQQGEVLRMDLAATDNAPHEYIYIAYQESVLLRQLTIYPYVQLVVVAIFFGVAVAALLAAKRAEQNRVWVGLSRETAHQLGTPISSLMAWSEVLRESYPDDELLPEMDKDIRRLQLIAERFSKIGSAPELQRQDVRPIVQQVAAYYDRRSSARVHVHVDLPAVKVEAAVNAPLFEWVIENLCKNAIDAMQSGGELTLALRRNVVMHHATPICKYWCPTQARAFRTNVSKPCSPPASLPSGEGGGLASHWPNASSRCTTTDVFMCMTARWARAQPLPSNCEKMWGKERKEGRSK